MLNTTNPIRQLGLEIAELSGIYVAIQRDSDGTTVRCSGIVTFNSEGRMSGEFTGGELKWITRKQTDSQIKNLVKRHVQGNLERTAGVRYRVSDDKIFLVDKKVYNRVLKKAKLSYARWLESQASG